jgi:hypothetical protein
MTVNELSQAIRNLMMSQPMISAGPMGGVINSAMAILDSYRNFAMTVQTYPMQDSFKFNSISEMQRFENTLTMLVCQSFQEKGINVMAYMMQGNMAMMNNPYVQPMQPNMQPTQGTHSHLAFNQPQAPRFGGNRPVGQFQPQYGMGPAPAPGAMPQPPMGSGAPMPPRPPMGGYPPRPPMGNGAPMPPRPPMGGYPSRPPMGGNGSAPKTYPKTSAPAKPIAMDNAVPSDVAPEQKPQEVEIPMPVVQPSKASIKTQEISTAKPTVTKAPSQKPPLLLDTEPEVMDFGGGADDVPPSGPAAGRDYLLQLLKK